MVGGNEQRVAIKFCFKAGLSMTGTLVSMQKAYISSTVNKSVLKLLDRTVVVVYFIPQYFK
jgi:hypothetical protein